MSRPTITVTGEDALLSPERRTLLKGAAAGLVIGFHAMPKLALAAKDLPKSFVPNAFVTVAADESVTLTMAKIEMGQGTYTSIPMLLAEELEVDVSRISLRHAPPDAKTYGLPFGDQFTGGSTSIRTLFEPMRQAGASARVVLIQAAAEHWRVDPASCFAQRGQVIHKPTGRRISYGKLVARASQLPLPAKVALKPASEFKVIGKPVKRLDAKSKTNGTAKYGIDAIVPGMKFASVVNSPVIGGKVKSVDDSATRSMRGIRQVVVLDDAVAVVADNTWYAKQGAAALKIQWDDGPNAKLSTDDVRKLMVATLGKPGTVARNDGDAQRIVAADAKRVESLYISQMLAHAAMEPVNATVHVKADSAEIWTGTQVPARLRDSAAKLLGLAPERVTLNNSLLGGGFGRRLYHDQVDQAVLVGKRVDGPVKVTWTREEDIQHDVYRGLYAHSVSASLNDQGYPVALWHKFAGPSNLATFAPGFIGPDGVDSEAVDGSRNLAYAIANVRTEHVREEGPVATGFWRGVGPSRNVPVLEGFIDELAARAGKDPLQYRLAMLSKDDRARHVVSRAAQLAGWGEKLAQRRGKGVALLFAFDTYIGQVVDLSVDPAGQVKVHKVTCVVDCGLVVNPDTVVAQMQSGINFGLTAALYGDITIQDGRVQQSNFHDYPPLRMSEAPVIEVEVVRSSASLGGIGEPGTSAVLAAFANAIHAATGKRLYTLPVKADQLAAS
ncbi:MAG TPA: molybdopterin cofactor-binding domain-containing protein [Albitalea sp.]|uniref:xanthine dehydrogenase family protein molybdopterin-binding subunit n=1 Tax=Piscinibacter sp. TaxID=1903157 RepID=UPI002ED3A31A